MKSGSRNQTDEWEKEEGKEWRFHWRANGRMNWRMKRIRDSRMNEIINW